jgi:hypothetical protein
MEKGLLQAPDFAQFALLNEGLEPLNARLSRNRKRADRVETPDWIRPLVTPFRVRENAKID